MQAVLKHIIILFLSFLLITNGNASQHIILDTDDFSKHSKFPYEILSTFIEQEDKTFDMRFTHATYHIFHEILCTPKQYREIIDNIVLSLKKDFCEDWQDASDHYSRLQTNDFADLKNHAEYNDIILTDIRTRCKTYDDEIYQDILIQTVHRDMANILWGLKDHAQFQALSIVAFNGLAEIRAVLHALQQDETVHFNPIFDSNIVKDLLRSGYDFRLQEWIQIINR